MTIAQSAMHIADPDKAVSGIDQYQPPKKKREKAKSDRIDTRTPAQEQENSTGKLIIHEDERNYRQHSQHNLDLIGYSMDAGGMGRPIFADNTGSVIGGNGTLRMANQRGIPQRIIHTDGSELIVVVRDDLNHDDPKRQMLAVMDNSTTDSSTFDYDLMQQDFSIDDLENMGVEIPVVEIATDDEYMDELLGEDQPEKPKTEKRCPHCGEILG
jgi:hypothetical protein